VTLETVFKELAGHYSKDELLINKCWKEIERNYSHKKRYYHNLSHLERLIEQLQEYQTVVTDWHTILFSVFYHDSIYKVLLKDNEEKSAAVAVNNLNKIGFPEQKIIECSKQILATKTHMASADNDTNLFTDADLSVLGQAAHVYEEYCHQIRKEYAVYPDIIYKPGRKKVIAHFLGMDSIFKTPAFFDRYEKQAKENLQLELQKPGR